MLLQLARQRVHLERKLLLRKCVPHRASVAIVNVSIIQEHERYMKQTDREIWAL
jgi:hypothetical protein